MTRGKKLLILFLALCGGACVLVVLLGLFVYRQLSAPFGTKEAPPELREARVISGAEFLSKSVFYRPGEQKGSWRDWLDREKMVVRFESNDDLAAGQLDGLPGLDVGLARSFGLTLLDREGRVTRRVNYQFEKGTASLGPLEAGRERNSFHRQRVIDIEGDGVCEVMGYGGLDGLAVFDHQGRVVLSRGPYERDKPSIQNASAGDVDGDGVLEFVASWGHEPAGIELLDRFGNSRWRRKEEFAPGPFAVVDVDGDGRREIVEDDGEKLKLRDAEGKPLPPVKMPVYLWDIETCPGAEGDGPPRNLAVREGHVWLIDFDGKNFTKFDAPLSVVPLAKPREEKIPGIEHTFTEDEERVSRAAGAWVRLKKDEPKYLAVVGEFVLLDRSVFYVYDSRGKLVYHELLPEECADVVALPAEDGGDGAEEILVGGEKTVWRYAAR